VAEYAQFPPEVVRLAKRKAEALEATTAAGGPTSNDDSNRGSHAARRTLKAFAALPLADMRPQQAFAEVHRLFPPMLAAESC
jgi:DNA mismatch repair ATPase MutS